MTTDNFCFYLLNRLIKTSQAGGQWYSDTSPFSIPWLDPSNGDLGKKLYNIDTWTLRTYEGLRKSQMMQVASSEAETATPNSMHDEMSLTALLWAYSATRPSLRSA